MSLQVPPQSIDAEISVLGGLLLDEEAFDEISDLITPGDFYKPSHQVIYGAICELKSSNSPIDLVTLSNLLKEQSKLDSIGGTQYLLEIVDRVVSSANIVNHSKIITDKSLLRKLISTSSKIVERAYNQDFEDIGSFIDEAEASIFQVGESGGQTDGLINAMEVVRNSMVKIEELYGNKQETTGIRTGFNEFDKMTAGLQSGELIILAARPSMGKTAFSLNMALNIALREKKNIAFFSLEMGKEAIMMRFLAQQAKINMGDLRIGRISDNKWPELINAAGELSESNLFIDDTSGLSPFELRAKCRRLKAQHGLDAIIIDYLQLMRMKTKVDSREREVAEISSRLKELAKELQIPVIALAQLNRGVEGRNDKRPMLSDLRESGSIEQDADLILMLYREEYYDRDDPDKKGNAECIIGKHRNGPTGTVKLTFDARYGLFQNPQTSSFPAHPVGPPPANVNFAPTEPGTPAPPKNFAPNKDS